MSIAYKTPPGSVALYPNVEMSAILNVSTGQYEFDNAVLVPLMSTDPQNLYLLESLSVGVNVTDDDFYESLIEAPRLSFKQSSEPRTLMQHFPNPLEVVQISNDSLTTGYFYTDSKDVVNISASGLLQQVVGTISKPTIDLRVMAVVRRITNQEFIRTIRAEW